MLMTPSGGGQELDQDNKQTDLDIDVDDTFREAGQGLIHDNKRPNNQNTFI